MTITETRYEHIVLTTDQIPIIADTTMKVIELVLAKHAHGWSPEELQFQYPSLSMGQIYSALAYYADHQERLDQDIQRRLTQIDRVAAQIAPAPIRARLYALRGR